jgi:ParB family transcriptional regulator, chromosome partitioning protein
VAERGMGRGLAAILPRGQRGDEGLRELQLELIDSTPRQPRRSFDEDALAGLAASVRSRGVLQPVVVRPLAGGRYQLVAGERRLRAARLAGLNAIPAMVRQTEDWERLDVALAENMAREDLNPIEAARGCSMLVDDLGLSRTEVARRVGRSRAAISNLLRLLELPEEALALIEAGELSEGHGRALLLSKDHAARRRLALDARDAGWSVRETERRAREVEPRPRKPPRRVAVHPDLQEALAAAEDALSAALRYEVRARPRGDSCRIEIDFETPGEAVALAERLLARRRGSLLSSAAQSPAGR